MRKALAILIALAIPATATAAPIALKPSERPGKTMTLEKYRAYMNLFNHRDERFADYYDPGIVFDHGDTGGILRGREAIRAFYRNVWTQIAEKISAKAVAIDNVNGVMAVELTTDLTATADVTRTPGIHMKKGDRVILKEMVLYGLKNGRFSWVRSPEISRESIPAKR